MRSISTICIFYIAVLSFVHIFAQDGKERVGKLTESEEVPPAQRMVTDILAETKEELRKRAEAVKARLQQGCTYGFCGGHIGCCEGYFCDTDNFCRQSCDSRTCLVHPDECCVDYFCNEGRCENYCSTSYCGHGETCCDGYYCDGYMCQDCSTTYCGHGETCCDGYYCDGYMCQLCSTTYCGHGEVCCDGYYCDGYMCRSSA